MKSRKRISSLLPVVGMATLLLASWTLLAPLAGAQRAPGSVGLGAEIGEPSGITLMIYKPNGPSYDFLAAWDMDNFFFLNGHGLFEEHLGRSGRTRFFYGPGGFVGIRDRARGQDDDVVVGVSGRFGVGHLFDRFEVYAQLTPRLSLTPSTDGDLGGGVGFRFFFR